MQTAVSKTVNMDFIHSIDIVQNAYPAFETTLALLFVHALYPQSICFQTRLPSYHRYGDQIQISRVLSRSSSGAVQSTYKIGPAGGLRGGGSGRGRGRGGRGSGWGGRGGSPRGASGRWGGGHDSNSDEGGSGGKKEGRRSHVIPASGPAQRRELENILEW